MKFGLREVSKAYDGLTVLDDLSLEFPVGKISCLLGPSGIGKTTILNIVAGWVSPDSGALISPFNGSVSYLFQESLLFPWMTVMENVCYLMDESLAYAEKQELARELLSHMELDGFDTHYPRELSGGMVRRVALARALGCPNSLLLMDEPFTALDSRLKTRIVEVVRKNIVSRAQTVVLVTHDQKVAEQIGDCACFCSKKEAGGLEVRKGFTTV